MLRDRDATRLGDDPVFCHALGDVASEPTVSRRLSRMTLDDVERLGAATGDARASVARVAPRREFVAIGVDSTLTPTFGRKQEGSAFNHHHQARGYHPLIATDTLSRDVVGLRIRQDAQYCSKGSGDFVGRVLDGAMAREPGAKLAVRADSGFATPEFQLSCEGRGAIHVVRLKLNRTIHAAVLERLDDHFVPGVARTVTGELMYRTDSWDRPRRGETEQILGEARGFARGCVCSKPMEANAFRCQLAVLAHGPLTWLRLLCLGGSHASAEPRTLPLDFVRVAARRVTHGRRACFHFSIARASQWEFFRVVVGCDRISRELRVA